MRKYILGFIFLCAIIIPIIIYTTTKNTPILDTIALNANWQFRQVGTEKWLNATIPGTVHTDLMANNIIEDPFFRDNGKKQVWIESEDFEYATTIDITEAQYERQNIELVCEGLDTYADIYINEKLLRSTENMFVSYTIPCKEFLKVGKNDLRILFQSATKVGLKKLNESPYLVPAVNEFAPTDKRTSVFTRKAPYHYGWDWGPRIVTIGIWKPIYMQSWDDAKIVDAYHELKNLSDQEAEYDSEIEIQAQNNTKLEVELLIDGKKSKTETVALVKGLNKVKLKFTIDNPKLWWPKGAGEQPLYEIKINLLSNSIVIDSKIKTIGVRTVEVVQEPDSVGKSFKFRVNGKDIFIKGTNYIPTDNLLTRVTQSRYEKVIKAATDANMNMIRVWGGAIYESKEFYDLCDKNGLLVWQDFMFACSMSPGNEAHLKNLQLEFTDNVKRLRQHPSLAMWCGNNENMVAWFGWDLQKKYKLSPSDSTDIIKTYVKIFYDLIPNTIKEYDSTRYYWPSSPSGGYELKDNQSPKTGDVHDWWIWFGKASGKDITSKKQRFISEYGLQSYPEMKTIRAFTKPEDRAFDSKLFDYKQRSEMPWIGKDKKGNLFNGNDMIDWYVNNSYRQPSNFEDFVYLSQLVQAEELKASIEGHRSHKPYCWGTMYWQLDDCWPTVSWSSVDYYFRWKAAHYFIKKAYQNITIVPFLKDKKVSFQVLSDKMEDVKLTISYTAMDFGGKILASNEAEYVIEANSSNTYLEKTQLELIGKNNPKQSLVYCTIKEKGKIISENILYFDAVKNLELPVSQLTKTITISDKYVEIELKSDVLVKNVYLYNDEMEGFFSDNFVDVLPGIPAKIKYTSAESLKHFEKNLMVKSVRDSY